MRVEVFTIFPEMVSDYSDVHRSVADAPFGGGAGMVLMPEPVFTAVESARAVRPLFLLGPAGRRFDHSVATELAELDGFSLLCGRYEGVDDRIRTDLCDGELSIGDFVLAGGELAALMVIEAVARLRPGILGNEESTGDESFTDGLLEYPRGGLSDDDRALLAEFGFDS